MKNSNKINLYSKLKEYSETDIYPFHMPGHKRNTELLGVSFPFDIDITEIDGFDNLYKSEGILKNITDKAKKVFHSQHSYMLINGSTCGILAAIRTVTRSGDSIIIARNCHKSVYNGCMLNNLTLNFIFPSQDEKSGVISSVTPESVLKAINTAPNARAVVITSPTYEGVISDISTIAKITHSFNIPLIVDNAHGAHQIFCEFCKGEPISCGADIVVSSLHKTLPSLTQTAIAHVNGTIVSPKRFEQALKIFETSSPSYILISSIDRCLDFLENNEYIFTKYKKNLRDFSERVKVLKHLTVLCQGSDNISNHDFYSFDYGKIVICTAGTSISGVELMTVLRNKYNLELEMSYPFYAVAMTSACDTSEGFNRLAEALIDLDKYITFHDFAVPVLNMPKPKNSGLTVLEAMEQPHKDNSEKNIVNGFIYAYPPGVPILIPGEVMNDDISEYINKLIKSGVEVISD